MPKIILILISALVLFGCSQKNVHDKQTSINEIKKADIEMSALAEQEGFSTALLKNADENFVKLSEGIHPVIGKSAFEELTNGKPGPKTLTWEAVFTDVAESGDLGYSWGNWKFVLPDTVFYGNYFTVWKKHNDSKWKMTLDGGNGTPKPND